jgi:hypothetical protein
MSTSQAIVELLLFAVPALLLLLIHSAARSEESN